jgi:hypothetical protein
MKQFEKDFITQLETRFPELLKSLRNPMGATEEKALADLAGEVALNYY